MDAAYDYVIRYQHGMFMKAKDYPYTGHYGTCRFSLAKAVSNIVGYMIIATGNEMDLAANVAVYGPAAIAIDSNHMSFRLYSGGIYDEPRCSASRLDLGVGCVGFGTEGNKNYWIIRNSWGASWGENGYIRMVKDKNNQCGEATMAIIPVQDKC